MDKFIYVPVYVGNLGDTVWTRDMESWTSTSHAPIPDDVLHVAIVQQLYPPKFRLIR